MKKLQHIALLLIALCTLSLTGCKDDEDDVSPNEAFLTEKAWTGEGIYVRPPFLPLTNVSTLLRALGEDVLAQQLDITTTTFEFDRNGTFRATRDGNTQTGTWRFTDNESKIVISGNDVILAGANNEEATFNVLELNATNFNLETDVTELGFDPADLQGINKFELRMIRR